MATGPPRNLSVALSWESFYMALSPDSDAVVCQDMITQIQAEGLDYRKVFANGEVNEQMILFNETLFQPNTGVILRSNYHQINLSRKRLPEDTLIFK